MRDRTENSFFTSLQMYVGYHSLKWPGRGHSDENHNKENAFEEK